MNSDAKALRSGVWYTLSNFLLQGIAFITTPIFTRLMTKSDFGSFSNYTAWLSIVA
ncbi:MAG: oligosaccharide flippase family protein, partial [Lachnospiraceae bacterium]|nr:oligosaccharide flippase family protein [Lachnospiraceae bacterium]